MVEDFWGFSEVRTRTHRSCSRQRRALQFAWIRCHRASGHDRLLCSWHRFHDLQHRGGVRLRSSVLRGESSLVRGARCQSRCAIPRFLQHCEPPVRVSTNTERIDKDQKSGKSSVGRFYRRTVASYEPNMEHKHGAHSPSASLCGDCKKPRTGQQERT